MATNGSCISRACSASSITKCAALPPRGVVGVFNRSHYEDVVAVRMLELAPDDVSAAPTIVVSSGRPEARRRTFWASIICATSSTS